MGVGVGVTFTLKPLDKPKKPYEVGEVGVVQRPHRLEKD